MRVTSIIIFFFISFSSFAEVFTVFEKDGFFGIRDQEGQVTVPAVYERLGWSNGTTEVINGVIGYREGKLWGLISAKNKSLTEQKFYTINPFEDGLIKASIKGKFSNQLFHGLIDVNGKTVLAFKYFTVDSTVGGDLLVSEYENSRQRFGIASLDNGQVIACNYQSIDLYKGFYLALYSSHRYDLYASTGELIVDSLDSAIYLNGWKCFKNGYAGYVSKNGIITHPFEYKNFELADNILFPIPFSNWQVIDHKDEVLHVQADSIRLVNKDVWVIYLNGAHHIKLEEEIAIGKNQELKIVEEDYLILKDTKTQWWIFMNRSGETFATDYDSMAVLGEKLWAQKSGLWYSLDHSGKRLNRLGYKQVISGPNEIFAVSRNGHWGLINKLGREITALKYDTMIPMADKFKVGYLNRWGVMSTNGNWEVRPEFGEVFVYKYVTVGKRGHGYTYMKDGVPVHKSESRPLDQYGNFLIVQNQDNQLGLVNEYGEQSYYPMYDEIEFRGNEIAFRQGDYIELIRLDGKKIIKLSDRIQAIGKKGNGLYPIKKDDRWGFIDDKGRLRISNRYEEVRTFSDSLSAIKLREKWGFINFNEQLVIQPYYEEVSDFFEGLCIVKTREGMGLINTSGEEVISSNWDVIKRSESGTYLVRKNGKSGLVGGNGAFLLRPIFEGLIDHGNRVIVVQNGKYGLLDYSGNQLIKVEKKEIKISSNYTLVNY